jgi:hypothetical protein
MIKDVCSPISRKGANGVSVLLSAGARSNPGNPKRSDNAASGQLGSPSPPAPPKVPGGKLKP